MRTEYVVPGALAGERLDRVLESLLDGVSRSQAQKLVRRGDVLVAGKRIVRSNGRVDKGARIVVESEAPPPELRVLYTDDDLVVVVKPAGALTHATGAGDRIAVAQRLAQMFDDLPTDRGGLRPGVVHRLDRETSGLLVFARNSDALQRLQDQFRARSVTKLYLALVSGVPDQTEFTIELPIGPVRGKADRQGVDPTSGKEARTSVRLVTGFSRHALLECRIHTGRRHQIRVHLAELGLPVLGDPLYGTKRARPLPPAVPAVPRLALHASALGFDHPSTGARMEFTEPLPSDLDALAEALRDA